MHASCVTGRLGPREGMGACCKGCAVLADGLLELPSRAMWAAPVIYFGQ